ncbi:amidohydrolase family protein [Nocardia terpenica]|uniref:Amidohydrolase n=1 Tax=Nocardia terpenica TaxID=455432 RepID=A0A291RGC3_9NOCA|nr:amidohydrolase family protein [Nocardia terpenica]ATL66348.1 amidohydrolase [Nocardia terpenica]
MSDSARIDVHQHILPPSYRQTVERLGLDAGGWPIPPWSTEAALAMMDGRGMATGVLSVSAPGTHTGDDAQAREISRAANEFTAELVKDRPDRFGQFASLPLPDVDGAVAEAVYSLDVLHADGVVLMANARGRYLGDPAFEPLWAELNARAAVVFIHPTEMPLPMLPGLPAPVTDFPFDTTRTAVDLARARVPSRYPQLKIILSHAGGALPYLASRIAIASEAIGTHTPAADTMSELRRFYFDTALSASPTALPSLTAFADHDHILYGSDWPFAADPMGTIFDDNLDAYFGWDTGQLTAVNRGNAEKLFPRLVG